MALTEDTAAEMAHDLAEAIGVVIKIVSMSNADRVFVAKYFFDDMIGTDETALIQKLPLMTPEMTEMLTDMLIPMLAEALIAKLTAPEPV